MEVDIRLLGDLWSRREREEARSEGDFDSGLVIGCGEDNVVVVF